MELYKKYRPRKLEDMHGLDQQVAQLGKMLSNTFPRSILLSGPSGCGKTTLARILRKELNCGSRDYEEINAAQCRGIDKIREVTANMTLSPISGKCRIYYFDECHQLTGDSQNGMLKILEDTPQHVYFFLATTEPEKLKRAIITRCTEVKVVPLSPEAMSELLTHVCRGEEREVSDEVLNRIVEVSDGSARQGIKVLEQALAFDDEEQQLAAIQDSSSRRQGESIARLIMNPKLGGWKEVAALIKDMDENAVESARRGILGYAGAVFLNGNTSNRVQQVIRAMEYDFFRSGKATFALNCFEIFQGK